MNSQQLSGVAPIEMVASHNFKRYRRDVRVGSYTRNPEIFIGNQIQQRLPPSQNNVYQFLSAASSPRAQDLPLVQSSQYVPRKYYLQSSELNPLNVPDIYQVKATQNPIRRLQNSEPIAQLLQNQKSAEPALKPLPTPLAQSGSSSARRVQDKDAPVKPPSERPPTERQRFQTPQPHVVLTNQDQGGMLSQIKSLHLKRVPRRQNAPLLSDRGARPFESQPPPQRTAQQRTAQQQPAFGGLDGGGNQSLFVAKDPAYNLESMSKRSTGNKSMWLSDRAPGPADILDNYSNNFDLQRINNRLQHNNQINLFAGHKNNYGMSYEVRQPRFNLDSSFQNLKLEGGEQQPYSQQYPQQSQQSQYPQQTQQSQLKELNRRDVKIYSPKALKNLSSFQYK